jgi:hypothetical protein
VVAEQQQSLLLSAVFSEVPSQQQPFFFCKRKVDRVGKEKHSDRVGMRLVDKWENALREGGAKEERERKGIWNNGGKENIGTNKEKENERRTKRDIWEIWRRRGNSSCLGNFVHHGQILYLGQWFPKCGARPPGGRKWCVEKKLNGICV